MALPSLEVEIEVLAAQLMLRPLVLVLALAGRFATAQRVPAGPGTLPTHRPLFVTLLVGVALVVVGLTFVPVLVLGPIVESLS